MREEFAEHARCRGEDDAFFGALAADNDADLAIRARLTFQEVVQIFVHFQRSFAVAVESFLHTTHCFGSGRYRNAPIAPPEGKRETRLGFLRRVVDELDHAYPHFVLWRRGLMPRRR